MKPGRQLLLAGLGSLLLAGLGLLWGIMVVLRASLDEAAWRQLDDNLRMARHMLHEQGAAAELRGGRLWFGALTPEAQQGVLEELRRVTGGTASLLQGDLRVATTLVNPDGTPQVGTRLTPGPERDAAWRGHASAGRLRILGRDDYAVYDPILDRDGHRIGTLSVALPRADTARAFARIRGTILALSAVLIAGAGCVLWGVGRRITRRMERDEGALRAINARFDAALTSMMQGLALFDAGGRLAVVNQQFAAITGLPGDKLRPGLSLAGLGALSIEAGNMAPDELRDTLARHAAADASCEPEHFDRRTRHGIMAVTTRRLPDGGRVFTVLDVTTRRSAEAHVRFLAWHDPLTGLLNRFQLREQLGQALRRLAPDQGLAVLLLDLDGFRMVNDALGQGVGDALLQAVAARLRTVTADGDLVARLGGDEFAIVRPGAGADEADALAGRVIEALEPAHEVAGHQLEVGASFGISVAPADGMDADRLLRNAALALTVARGDGRGVRRCFEPAMEARLLARRALEAELRRAVADGAFELFFQPLVCARSGRVTAFEALLRWPHPERGLVSPAEFIPLAEETGLIVPLGEWVLRRACAEAAGWPDGLRVAVNLSPAQVLAPGLVATVEDALRASGLPAGRLELEITESMLLRNSDATRQVLHRLRRGGLRVAMDDFGTGYSSLSYLRSFPFDKLKIDRSFVMALDEGADALAIVRAITQLADSLHMAVVAEGVETAEQLRLLRSAGVGEMQGYHLGRPMPARDARALLARLAEEEAVA